MAQRGRGAVGPRPPRADRGPAQDSAGASTTAPLRDIAEPIVAKAGLDLEELTVTRVGRRHVVRVVIDGDGGVGHDELSDVSRQVSAALDAVEVSNVRGALAVFLAQPHTIEVSSPGVQRPLTLPRHWRRNMGRLVKVTAGGRTLIGRVVVADDNAVTLESDGQATTLAYDELGPGRVQVEFTHGSAEDESTDDESTEDESTDDEAAERGGIGSGEHAQAHSARARQGGEDGA